MNWGSGLHAASPPLTLPAEGEGTKPIASARSALNRAAHLISNHSTEPTMTRLVVKPADLDLESPGRRDYWVALEHDTMWGAQ